MRGEHATGEPVAIKWIAEMPYGRDDTDYDSAS